MLNVAMLGKLPQQAGELLSLIRHMDDKLSSMDDKLTPVPDKAPAPVHLDLSTVPYATSQQLHITSMLISTDAVAQVDVTIGNGIAFTVFTAAGVPVQLRWSDLEAMMVGRGFNIAVTATAAGAVNLSAHAWAFVD